MIKHRPESHDLDEAQFRKVVAVQYINASSEILRGMKQLVGANNFLVLVCLSQLHRIHKARNMASFLCETKSLLATRKLSFMESGTDIITADKRISKSLGRGEVSGLLDPVAGVGEPFMNCLHALTHGNPIMTRMLAFGLDKCFNTPMLVVKAEAEYHMFLILLGRQLLGQDSEVTWKTLSTIYNRPNDLRDNARIVVHLLKQQVDLENLLLNGVEPKK